MGPRRSKIMSNAKRILDVLIDKNAVAGSDLTVREIADLVRLLHTTKKHKRILNKLVNESNWYFSYTKTT